ncbi:MAG: sucrase ferredoxin [Jiangellaceae bacterium]
MAGTASTVRPFLLIQQAGPWGVDALQDSRIPTESSATLSARCRDAGVRPLLIRRHARRKPVGVRVFAAYADPHEPWLETTTLTHLSEVAELDLVALGRGESPRMTRRTEPVFLVCTHGRHDVCCAERGRPLARALNASHPEQTWECSHIGGDRFAGNLLMLPEGIYYGRADADSGPRIAAGHLAGRLDLDHMRGRAGYGFVVQAAEWHLRRQLSLTGLSDVVLVGRSTRGDVTSATFDVVDRGRWLVRLRSDRGAPQLLTCRSPGPQQALRTQLVSVSPAADGAPSS